jgi:heme oxygenase
MLQDELVQAGAEWNARIDQEPEGIALSTHVRALSYLEKLLLIWSLFTHRRQFMDLKVDLYSLPLVSYGDH